MIETGNLVSSEDNNVFYIVKEIFKRENIDLAICIPIVSNFVKVKDNTSFNNIEIVVSKLKKIERKDIIEIRNEVLKIVSYLESLTEGKYLKL